MGGATIALNSRQKRTRKRKLALALLAKSRNPSTVASKGRVRSAWSKTMPTSVRPHDAPWESTGKAGKSVKGHVVAPKKPLYRADGNPVRQIDTPSLSGMDRVELVPRDRIKATKQASSTLARKREAKWGVKLSS